MIRPFGHGHRPVPRVAHSKKDLWPESHPTRADRYADPSGVAQLTGPPTRPKVRFRTDE